ncbi:response regulator transcription factor [Roseivirga sp. E12]|uniref:response regulator n=1 Tax=Roseivirga sp. E12 TaxID=2819237 RepID=UPI001ABC9140|nr:response regulator transcription factor [Roseivirga sp. E12]MBO3699289.1 response regulator transcription factor [Roseivirga sp. E12]
MTSNIKRNVWIVEDDPYFKESLEDLVKSESKLQLICSVNSIEKALEGFGKYDAPKVVLQDIGLPGLSGIDAIPLFKERYPRVAIIMFTIFEDDKRVFEALKAGADGYLLKRTPGKDLIRGIHEVLNGGAPISPTIARQIIEMMAPRKHQEEKLTDRELTVLRHLVDGCTIDQIAEMLFISRHTVDTHTKNIHRKLQVHNRSSLTSKAIRDRLV